jgi:hypothetical protein
MNLLMNENNKTLIGIFYLNNSTNITSSSTIIENIQ